MAANKKQIYLIRTEEGPFKIGITINIKRRMRNLQTGSWAKLELVHLWDGDEDFEAELHKIFAGKRIRGEWFQFDEQDIAQIEGWILDPSEVLSRIKEYKIEKADALLKRQMRALENHPNHRAVRVNARRNKCLKDHPLEGENLYITPDGRRNCKKCNAERNVAYRIKVQNERIWRDAI